MSKERQETIADIVAEMRKESHAGDASCLEWVGEKMRNYADRIISAHNREMNAIAAQKTAEAHEAFCKNAELAEAIAAKDAEIDKLRALVGELADALLAACNDTCDYCKKHLNIGEASALICLHKPQCNVGLAYGRLVAKAREVVK